MNKFRHHMAKKALGMVVMVGLVGTLLSAVVMWLWNHVLVSVTNVQMIDIWQAAGILLLCRILFGRVGPPSWKGRGAQRGRWRKKWKQMSDDERQDLRRRWQDRCEPKKKDEKNVD